MADGKNTIVVYKDWKNIFEKLTDDEAGKLIKHLFRFVNDENPTSDRLIELVFEPIKLTLKRDLKHWETVIEKRRESGKKGGIASGEVRKQNEANEANASIVKQNEANEADSVIVIDSVIDSVIEIKEKDIVDLWNTLCSPPLSKIEKITKSRKTKIALRAKEIGSIDEFKKLFEKIKKTKFLHGENDRGWKANFDWVFENDKNWLKIIEGNYDKALNIIANDNIQTPKVPEWVKKAQTK